MSLMEFAVVNHFLGNGIPIDKGYDDSGDYTVAEIRRNSRVSKPTENGNREQALLLLYVFSLPIFQPTAYYLIAMELN
jgi:hypothetical protein